MKIDLGIVRKAIDDEPELPGGMPDEMWESIKGSREMCEKAMQMTVILTKAGIKNRLADALLNT